jgi:hypothetical protein
MLDEDSVFQDGDLGTIVPLANHHGAVDGFAAGQELCLGQDRRSGSALFPTIAPPLALGFQSGGTGDALHFVLVKPRLANLHDGDDTLFGDRFVIAGGVAAATAATATGDGLTVILGLLLIAGIRLRHGRALIGAVILIMRAFTAASASSAAATATAQGAAVLVLVV